MSVISENPKVSVLIPVYNYEKYVAKCIESVLDQTYKNIEIIAVDDGSTDRSGKILDEYAQRDNRLHVIHKENGGIGSAYKIAIENATGDFIAFLDSDDYMDLNAYERLVGVALKEDADVVEFGLRMRAVDGHVRSETNVEAAKFNNNNDVMRDYVCYNTITPLSRKFCKIKLFNNMKMLDYSVGIDEVISIQLMCKCERLVRIEDCLYNAIGEPEKDSVSRRAIDGKNEKILLKMHEEIIAYFCENNVPFKKEYIVRYLVFLAGRFVVIYKMNKNPEIMQEIYKEFCRRYEEIRNSEAFRETSLLRRIQLNIFKRMPYVYGAMRSIKYRVE